MSVRVSAIVVVLLVGCVPPASTLDAGAVVACCGCDAGAGTQVMTVHDQYFHPTSWRVASASATGGATQTARQGAGELGNAGFYRRMVHELPAGGSIAVTHQLLGYAFDPSTQGVLISIDFELDVALLSTHAEPVEVAQRLVLFHGGETYFAPLPSIRQTQWVPMHATGLTADCFRDAQGQAPRLASEVSFGLERSSVNGGATVQSVAHAAAELYLFIHH